MTDDTSSAPPCLLLGILDDGWAGLSDAARQRLRDADLVIGARRTLALVAPHLPPACAQRATDGTLGSVPAWIEEGRAAGRRVVALATGDPLCHGIASWLSRRIGRAGLEVMPAPSTLQLAFARLCRPWQDWRVASCHSGDAGEWPGPGEATPAHGLYPLLRAIAGHPRVAAFTGPENDPARLARALLAAGHGDEVRLSVAARLALPDETLHADLPLAAAAGMRFDQPNVVLVERHAVAEPPLFGLADEAFAQRQPERGLLTRLEVRAVSLARLALRPDSVLWDIGAGAGTVGLEAARLARHGHVWAIEKNAADCANARANALRLRATNYTLVEGRAPAGLDGWPDPDAVFIGGSGGELPELIARVLARLRPGGRLVMNFVTLENLAAATAALAAARARWDVTQLQAARSQPILDMHRLAALNPVWIVCAEPADNKETPCTLPVTAA